MNIQVAIDGPAGAGKSTVAKRVAASLGFLYVDTGAMYRAMGLYFADRGIDTDSEEAVDLAVEDADIRLDIRGGRQVVLLNGEDVTDRIRTERAGMMASRISAYASVRAKLVELQRAVAADRSLVMDGRDIGTAVLPEAGCKIYLTAGSDIRARRRFEELAAKGQKADLEEIERDIIERDRQDMTRAISPLRRADDAVEIDSSGLTIDEVVEAILCEVEAGKA